MDSRALSIYLQDHFAGATLGVELARRLRTSNNESREFGGPLAHICEEIETDRETLRRVMERLDVEPGRVKPAAAWVAEKLGRLKLNGRLRGYSPLSRVVELEGLAIGIVGKTCLWRSLEVSLGAGWQGFDFPQLAKRAELQRDTVEELRRQAVAKALPVSESQRASSSRPASL